MSEGAVGLTLPHRWSGLRRWQQGLVVAAVAYSLLHVAYSVCHYTIFSSDMYRSRDFERVFAEVVAWRQTGVLPSIDRVLYPPLYYVLLRPIAGLDFRTVTYLLYFLQFFYFPMALVFLVKAVSPSRTPSAFEYLIAAVLMINFQPFLETLAQHKVEGIELLLIGMALYAFRRQRDVWAGALICLAANLKYLPGVLVIYFMLKREWKVMQGVLLAMLACVVVLVPFYGLPGIWAYGAHYSLAFLFGHKYAGTMPEANIEWQSLFGMINRWFVTTAGMVKHFETEENAPVTHPQLTVGLTKVLQVVIGALYLFMIRRAWPRAEREQRWPVSICEIGLTVLMIFIFASAARVHYAILLLPAFIGAALLLLGAPRRSGTFERVLFVLAYSLTAMIIPGGALNRLPPHPVWGQYHSYMYLWMSMPFYGYVLLGVCLWRLRSRVDPCGVREAP